VTNAPLLSIVTSVCNGERYVRESIESVLAQQGVELELIVVDDGSTDRTASILADLATRDPRLRVLTQSNGGLTRALIRGCAEARGKYLARHDADDLSLPGRLAAQAALLDREPGVSFVSSWAKVIGPNGELLDEIVRDNPPTPNLREGQGPCGHGSVMMRREAYVRAGGYRSQFRFAQDWDLWWRLAEQGSLAIIPEFLYAYRFDEAGISAAHRDLQRRFGSIAARCAAARSERLPENALLEEAERLSKERRKTGVSPAAANYFIGRSLLLRRDPSAREYLWKAVRRQPWRIRAWASLLQSRARQGFLR